MNDRLVLLVVLPLCLVAGGAGAYLMRPPAPANAIEGAKLPSAVLVNDGLRADIDRLATRLDEISMRIDALSESRRASPAPLASDSASSGTAAPEVAALGANDAPVNLATDEDWLVFQDPLANLGARQRAWASLRERGLLDEAIAMMEERAAASPDDPAAQFDLGVGYIEKIQEVGGGIDAGRWATKADKAFDHTLALDEEHLDARLYKAMSLSFWPPIFGKRAEAIHQFEVLIEKQASHPANDSFADSYLLLGNLHMESGKSDKALEVWQQGAAAFPDNEVLAQKVAELSGASGGK